MQLRRRLGVGTATSVVVANMIGTGIFTTTGLRNARAKGKSLGRPRKVVDATRIAALRAQGCSWNAITSQLGIGVGYGLPRPSEPSQKPS